jgi:hypothetical protein
VISCRIPRSAALGHVGLGPVTMVRFMRQRAAFADLARDNAISLKAAYPYLHAALNVLAAQARGAGTLT